MSNTSHYLKPLPLAGVATWELARFARAGHVVAADRCRAGSCR